MGCPAPVPGQTVDQPAHLPAIPAGGKESAGLTGQPGFYAPRNRLLDHDNQLAGDGVSQKNSQDRIGKVL